MGCDYNIEVMHWELKSGLGLGEHQVSGDTNRREQSVGIAVLAYLFVLRVCHHEIVPGKPWSIFGSSPSLRPSAKARHTRRGYAFAYCVHFATRTPSSGSA